MAEIGAVLGYGPRFTDVYRHRARIVVDKILRGAKPADLPVEQPTKFDLVDQPSAAKAVACGRAAPAACAPTR